MNLCFILDQFCYSF